MPKVEWDWLVTYAKSKAREDVVSMFGCQELTEEQMDWLERKFPGFAEEAKKLHFQRYKTSPYYKAEQQSKEKFKRKRGL